MPRLNVYPAQPQRGPVLHTPVYNHSICTLVFVVIFSLSHLALPACDRGPPLKLKCTLHAAAATTYINIVPEHTLQYNKASYNRQYNSVNCKTKVTPFVAAQSMLCAGGRSAKG